MNKSLGDYNVEKSSSHNIRNIVWTLKNSTDTKKIKKKKTDIDKKVLKSSPTNIIYGNKPKLKSHDDKVFIIDDITDTKKIKKKKTDIDKKVLKSAASNCKIKQGFKRPGR